MALPRWNEKRSRWELDERIQGERHLLTSTKPEKAGLKEIKQKRLDIIAGKSAGRRLERVWDEYLEYVDSIGGSANKAQREAYGRNYIVPMIGHKKVNEITYGDWQNCILKAKPIKGKPLSKKSYSNLRSTIVNFCTWAKMHNMIESIPEHLRLPASADDVGKNVLMPKDIDRLFSVDHFYVNAWRLMLVTGLRPGEVYGLQFGDIDGEVLTIKRSVNSLGEVTKGKNKNARRTIVLGEIAKGILLDQQSKVNSGQWIFPDEAGGPIRPSASIYWFQKLIGADVSPYCLRHTFVSMTKSQLPDALMRQVVGHSKSMDTLGVYGKQISGDLEQAAKIIDLSMAKWLRMEVEDVTSSKNDGDGQTKNAEKACK